VHEQTQAEHARPRLQPLPERDEHRDGLTGARDDDALAVVYTLEQLRERTARVVGVVLSKCVI
jgi:hypothetical protein